MQLVQEILPLGELLAYEQPAAVLVQLVPSLVVAIALLMAVLAGVAPGFFSAANLIDIAMANLPVLMIALAMTLLASAGLFVRSLVNVSRVDLGLKIDNVVTFAVSPALNGYEVAKRLRWLMTQEWPVRDAPGWQEQA